MLARAFGSTVMVDKPGMKGSLRRSATESGVPTIIFEAGETRKFSPRISVEGLRGVLNVMTVMGMWSAKTRVPQPDFQVIVKASDWVRSEKGGILELKVRPGDLVYKGDEVGAVLNPFGRTVHQIKAEHTGIVIGTTTAPLAIPGTAVVHVARLRKTLAVVERSVRRQKRAKARKKKGQT
jgi:predicted deacylase